MYGFAPQSRSLFRMTPAQFSRYFMCCVFGLLFLVGCIVVVPNRAYRRSGDVGLTQPPPSGEPKQLPPSVDPIPGYDCKGVPETCIDTINIDPHGKKTKISQPRRFHLAFIEFDDMGELWSIGNLNPEKAPTQGGGKAPANGKSQLENALEVIKAAKQEAEASDRPLDVVTFIHGWHNNASPYDEKHKDYSLAGFEKSLQQLTHDPVQTVVVGVFIAWRGQVLSSDLLAAPTYWQRRDAAVRVGGPSMTEVLLQLMFETKGVQSPPDPSNKCQPEGLDPRAHFVAIGHSFGARVLEHAMGQPLLAMFLEQKREANACVQIWNERHLSEHPVKPTLYSPADLIVFLNPANDAFETKSMIEAFKRSGITVERPVERPKGADDDEDKSTRPLLISITSKSDWVTGIAMPIAQKLGTQGIGFRKYDDDRCSKGQLHLRHQTNFWRSSDAHIQEMTSHAVVPVDLAYCSSGDWHFFTAPVKGENTCFYIGRLYHTSTPRTDKTEKDDTQVECYQEQKKAQEPWNDTPFWVLDVDPKLIPKHSDIFEGGTLKLLITIANHYGLEPSKRVPPSADQCDVWPDCTLGQSRGY